MRANRWVFALLFLPMLAFARAGGAGGGHHSSSSSGSGFHGGSDGGDIDGFAIEGIFRLVIYLLRSGPIGWLILAVVCFVAYQVFTSIQSGRARAQSSGFTPPIPTRVNEDKFASAFPGEDFNAFRDKVKHAFFTVQECWSAQNLAPMRRFISDGVYRRFHAQLVMMKLLGQRNPMTDVQVLSVQIAKVWSDGAYQCVDVMIRASATDQFTCEKFPELDSPGGNEAFTEFWSFVRRVDHQKAKDLFHAETCPQCAAPLTAKLFETARCPYCGTYLNSGEFDWVLAEITQESDYGVGLPLGNNFTNRTDQANAIRKLDPGFSVQILEDQASNAFMEILIGAATAQPALVKRFTTPEAFEALSRAWPKGKPVYDRLFTNTVELLRGSVSGKRAEAFVGIRYSSHLIDLAHPELIHEAEPAPSVKVLKMARNYSGGIPKGSVFAGSCPHCGAPQKDNLSPVCAYCNGQLNDGALDWVVEAVLDPAEYRALSDWKKSMP